MLPLTVSGAFRRQVIEVWGAEGERWLTELSATVRSVLHDWRLRLESPFPLSFNWVAAVVRADGTPAVLKLGVPTGGHLPTEVAALEVFAGHGAVRLLDQDLDRGALLLERVQPGTPASRLVPERDEAATEAFIQVVRRLHGRSPAAASAGVLPELAERTASFVDHLRTYPDHPVLPAELVARAGRLFDELCASAPGRVVLHGDLHHDNILRSDRGDWLAIDPHGVVGDPGYEVGALLYNPLGQRDDGWLTTLLPARIEQLVDGLAMPRERVVAWGFVQAVLSEVWTCEGGGTPDTRVLDVARALLPELP